MTASMLTLPALYAATTSLAAAWHPFLPKSVSVASGVATIACDGLAAMYWRPRAPKLGGAYIGAQPDHDYITTNAGAVITDTAGANLWI